MDGIKTRVDIDAAISHYEKKTGKKLTPYALAKQVGVPQPSLGKWSNGESLKTVDSVAKISEFTGYPIKKLIVIIKEEKDGL